MVSLDRSFLIGLSMARDGPATRQESSMSLQNRVALPLTTDLAGAETGEVSKAPRRRRHLLGGSVTSQLLPRLQSGPSSLDSERD